MRPVLAVCVLTAQASREAKWRAVLQDTRSSHGVEADRERQRWCGRAWARGRLVACAAALPGLLRAGTVMAVSAPRLRRVCALAARRREAVLADKEAEVAGTREELQVLLQELAAVQALQSRAAAAQQQRARGGALAGEGR